MSAEEIWARILGEPGNEELRARFVEALGEVWDEREIFRWAKLFEKYTVSYVQHDRSRGSYLASLAGWKGDLEGRMKWLRAEVVFVKGWPMEVRIVWLHALDRFMEKHPPSRHSF
ncbi:MAG TPA: hypothetical protein VGN88_10440 [Phycisphaerae bacterium]|jgi:hypothetical protein